MLTVMDPCWKNLPNELVDKICNDLPKVRAIPFALKNELIYVTKWRVFQRLIAGYEDLYGPMRGMDILTNDIYDVMNDFEPEPKNWWIAENAFEPWALFLAMDDDRLDELMVQN